MSIDKDEMAEMKAAALAEMESQEESANEPEVVKEVVKVVDKPVEKVEAKAEKPAEVKEVVKAKDEKPKEEEKAPEATVEEEPEEELEGDLDDYLPPADFKVEPDPEPEPVVDPRVAELEAELAWMKTEATRKGVDIDRPTLELSDEDIRELEDTSPVMARYVQAMQGEVARLNKQVKPPEPEMTQAEKNYERTRAQTKKNMDEIPEMAYWFNYKVPPGEQLPAHIDSAQKIVIEIEGELQKDPKYQGSQKARFKEAARLAVEQIKSRIEKRATTQSPQSIAAAPGSANEGSNVDRILALPATEMLAEINKLPDAEQKAIKRKMYG